MKVISLCKVRKQRKSFRSQLPLMWDVFKKIACDYRLLVFKSL